MEYKVTHVGRIRQIGIVLGKLFRMFVYQNDWKVFPMAAIIAEVVAFVIKDSMNVSMEGTIKGTFALSCVCIWNGFFNSIQVICRERAIVKREHRSGLHMSSYVIAHMIYQAFLCLCQSGVVLAVMKYSKFVLPAQSFMTGNVWADYFITFFLATFAADMIALFASSIAKNPTVAMTLVPFLMIFQLIFSGAFFGLTGVAQKASDYTISKWGITAMCALGNYNDLPMTSLWTTMGRMKNMKVGEILNADYFSGDNAVASETNIPDGESIRDIVESINGSTGLGDRTVGDLMNEIERTGHKDDVLKRCGEENRIHSYESTSENVMSCWMVLVLYGWGFAAGSMIVLEFIDKDKR